MKQYKTLKDLPGIPAGTIGTTKDTSNIYTFLDMGTLIIQYSVQYMKQYPDFFEEVKEEEKLFTLSDAEKIYSDIFIGSAILYGMEIKQTNKNSFLSYIENNFPHIKID